MATLEQLKSWRETLKAARFSGTHTVECDGKRVEYRSDAEMRQALADLEREITSASSRPPISSVRVFGSKGL